MMTHVFCAIDTQEIAEASAMVSRLSGVMSHFKLGLEFFTAQGAFGVDKVRASAGPETEIFLDLKLHDIPNTVAGAMRSAMRCQPEFLTVHASGGKEMMRAARHAAEDEAVKKGISRPRLLAVTVLTHLDDRDLESVGQKGPAADQVRRLADLAAWSGMDGVVCSPHEIAVLRSVLPKEFLLVVPGIRPAETAAGDQKRIMTPEEAFAKGADYLVIGRPITQAADPAAAAQAIIDSFKRKVA